MLQPQSQAARTRRSIADIDDTAVADPAKWYQRRLAEERDSGEPELGILPLLVPAGSTVLDVGTNLGLFAFAMSKWTAHVKGFELHPELAAFAQRMLAGRAQIHATAVSDYVGRGRFRVPYTDDEEVLHFAGNLCSLHSQFERYDEYDVDVVTLDSRSFVGVRFIKVDVESAELQVLAGAKALIACDRPILQSSFWQEPTQILPAPLKQLLPPTTMIHSSSMPAASNLLERSSLGLTPTPHGAASTKHGMSCSAQNKTHRAPRPCRPRSRSPRSPCVESRSSAPTASGVSGAGLDRAPAVDLAEHRAKAAVAYLRSGLECAYGEGLRPAAAGDADAHPLPCRVALAARDQQPQPLGREGDVSRVIAN
jgi:FkbM family methyltransferase